MISIRISAWTNGTALTRTFVTATTCFEPTSLTIAATNKWAAYGIISTLPRWDARKFGKTRPKVIRTRRPTNGGIGTTITRLVHRRTRSGSRSRTREKLHFERVRANELLQISKVEAGFYDRQMGRTRCGPAADP